MERWTILARIAQHSSARLPCWRLRVLNLPGAGIVPCHKCILLCIVSIALLYPALFNANSAGTDSAGMAREEDDSDTEQEEESIMAS